MNDVQTATPNVEALIDYILHLTPEQCDKLAKHIPLLKQLARMSKNELVFAETFLEDVCGKVVA